MDNKTFSKQAGRHVLLRALQGLFLGIEEVARKLLQEAPTPQEETDEPPQPDPPA